MPGDKGFEDSMEAMFTMQQEEKIGVSNVNADELQRAIKMGPISSVENRYGHAQWNFMNAGYGKTRGGKEVLDIRVKNEMPLIPFFVANCLCKKGKRAVKHFKENLEAVNIDLTKGEMDYLD